MKKLLKIGSVLFIAFVVIFGTREKARVQALQDERRDQCSAYIEQAKSDDLILEALLGNFQNKIKTHPLSYYVLIGSSDNGSSVVSKPNPKHYFPSVGSNSVRAPSIHSCPFVPEHWQEFEQILLAPNMNERVDSLSLLAFYQSQGNRPETRNPSYNPEKALQYLTLSAKEGAAIAQLLLAHLYETGSVLSIKVEKDPTIGTAWRVVTLSGDQNYATRNGKTYNQEEYINERCQLFGIEDCDSVHVLANQYLKDYPLTSFIASNPIDYSKKVYIKKFTEEHLKESQERRDYTVELIKKGAKEGYAHEMIAFGDSLVSQEFYYDFKVGTLYIHDYIDYEEAEKWYVKAYRLGSPEAAYKLGMLYAKVGNQQYGFNPLYDEKKSLEFLEIASDLGNKFALDVLYEYSRDFSVAIRIGNTLGHFDKEIDEAKRAINVFKRSIDVKSKTADFNSSKLFSIEDMLNDKEFFSTDKDRAQGEILLNNYINSYDFVKNSTWNVIDSLNYIEINDAEIVLNKLKEYEYFTVPRVSYSGRKLTKEEVEQAMKLISNYLDAVKKSM